MQRGISEIVGTGESAGASSVTVYRALRPLLCAPCGVMIGEGALFTRRRIEGQQLRTLPQCVQCAPFKLASEGGGERERSPLLQSLLAQPLEPLETAQTDYEKAREGVLKRLAPALRRARGRTP